MNVLELYSGIGGMHLALNDSGVKGEIVASIEINNIANEVYKHNFPDTKLMNFNIEGLTSNSINELNVNTILMSPPCQPFTRNGLQNDNKDPRTASFLHILKILPDLKNVTKILIENVKGFEKSDTRNLLIETLSNLNYSYQEFILSPHQFGIPNSRHRYYCLAKKGPEKFSFPVGEIMNSLPNMKEEKECFEISTILENNVDKTYFLSENLLQKRIFVVDIVFSDSRSSCCFTKAYGRYLEGTGSIFTDQTKDNTNCVLNEIKCLPIDHEDRLTYLKTLNLRFFTPKEICRLMCIPETFSFPSNITNRKKYMLLGNSINVKVVSELIKILNS